MQEYRPPVIKSSIETFIPKVPGGKYIGFKLGLKVKESLRRHTHQVPDATVERVDVIWPENASAISSSYILGLFYEQLKAADTLEQFKNIIVFKRFDFANSLIEAHRIARAMTKEQADKMIKTGTVPTIR